MGTEVSLDDVFRAADAVMPYFTSIMTELVEEADLDPDAEVSYKGDRLLLHHDD